MGQKHSDPILLLLCTGCNIGKFFKFLQTLGHCGDNNLTLDPPWGWVGVPDGRRSSVPLLYSEFGRVVSVCLVLHPELILSSNMIGVVLLGERDAFVYCCHYAHG